MALVDSIITLRFRLPKFNMPAAPLEVRYAIITQIVNYINIIFVNNVQY